MRFVQLARADDDERLLELVETIQTVRVEEGKGCGELWQLLQQRVSLAVLAVVEVRRHNSLKRVSVAAIEGEQLVARVDDCGVVFREDGIVEGGHKAVSCRHGVGCDYL